MAISVESILKMDNTEGSRSVLIFGKSWKKEKGSREPFTESAKCFHQLPIEFLLLPAVWPEHKQVVQGPPDDGPRDVRENHLNHAVLQ